MYDIWPAAMSHNVSKPIQNVSFWKLFRHILRIGIKERNRDCRIVEIANTVVNAITNAMVNPVARDLA